MIQEPKSEQTLDTRLDTHRSTLRASRWAGLAFRAKLHHISSAIFCTVRIDRALTTVYPVR